MRVLINGVSTAIGRDLARRLLAAGHDVTGLSDDPHRYLDPRIEIAARPRGAAAATLVAGHDVVVVLDADGGSELVEAAASHGRRAVTAVADESVRTAAERTDGSVLIIRAAPLVGRRIDAATLSTLAGLLRSDRPWQVLHHDDLTRALVAAVTGDATGTLELAAPGRVGAEDIRRALAAVGVPARLPGVRPGSGPAALDGETAGTGYGWTAAEAVADAARGLVGRTVSKGVARETTGRFVLPTEVIPNNLPPSDGGRLEPAGPPEFQGEFDTLLDPRFPVQTATNVAEALPRPMTPMSLDLQVGAIRISNESMGRMLTLDGVALEQHTNLMVGAIGHSVYMNASVGMNIVATMPGWDEESLRKDVYGQVPDDVVFRPEGGPPMPEGLAARVATLKTVRNVVARARKYKEEAERINAASRAEALTAEQIATLDDASLEARVLLWRDRLAHAWDVASIGVTLTGAAAAMHQRGKNPEEVDIDVEQLESGRTMLAVERLATVLRGKDKLVELARDGRVEELLEASPEVARVLAEQLAVMGHRGPGECELANPPFADRPALLLGYAASAAGGAAAQRTPVTPPTSRTGRMSAGATLARERARDGVTRYTHCLRLGVRELGRRLVERGLLETPEDAFYLTLDEALTAPADATERVARRRAERERLQRIRMPDVVIGTWEPAPDSDALDVGQALHGLGVYPGVVEGPVRILRGPDDDIEPDDILVASVTDVGHTAMFGYAAAVVTDIGGAASHAAIVAREFGVPCVVDTKTASTALEDGQLVRVDGAAGTVTRLS